MARVRNTRTGLACIQVNSTMCSEHRSRTKDPAHVWERKDLACAREKGSAKAQSTTNKAVSEGRVCQAGLICRVADKACETHKMAGPAQRRGQTPAIDRGGGAPPVCPVPDWIRGGGLGEETREVGRISTKAAMAPEWLPGLASNTEKWAVGV